MTDSNSVRCLNLQDPNNVGDRVCNPARYFAELGAPQELRGSKPFSGLTVYGGGAITCFAVPHARKAKGPTVAWGIGNSVRNKTSHPSPDYSVFDLAGSRDYGHSKNWVPCVSCLDASLLANLKEPPKFSYVFYGHAAVMPLTEMAKTGYPVMHNNEPQLMAEAIKFLALGETVVTSSYHGAYWAMLLGRKVICIPFGSKFYYYRDLPAFATAENWKRTKGIKHSGLLEEYRSLNTMFFQKVLNRLP